jgi:hypothetical protein
MDTVRVVTAEEEIADLKVTRPHVVILGAGASYAACRTGEAYINQFIDAMFIQNNPIPRNAGFDELWARFDRLLEVECEDPQSTA